MKIALIHYAAPPVVGGVETVLGRQAQQLVRAGHHVVILAGRGETWDARMPVQVLPHLDSRHPHVLKAKAGLDAGQVPPDFQPLADAIQGELHRALEGVDVVIAHNVASLNKNLALTAALFALSQAPTAPRFILWHHDLAWTTPRYQGELHPGLPWDLLRRAWPGVRQVTVSVARQQELAHLMGIPPETITVVPAGLEPGDFLGLQPRTMALMQALRLNDAAPLLLTPVRITRRKNLELALTTLAALRGAMPQAMLVVTGPPGAHNPSNQEYLEKLQTLIKDLGLKDAAHLLADVAPQGLPDVCVADLFRVADALLLPSREEGFGIPILEAAMSRMPIFCSSLPPLQALAGPWAAYFSPDDAPTHVATLIEERLNADPAYRLRVSVRQGFTWEAIYRDKIAPLLTGAR